MSMVAGQLLPVRGTPQAKAAFCTPGSAATARAPADGSCRAYPGFARR